MSDELKVKKGNMTRYLLAIALSTQVLTAWAQDDATADADDDATTEESEDSADLGRVQVTGSLLQREDFSSISPMQVIDAETQFQAGQLTAADVLQKSTVAAGTTQLNNQFQGFVIQGGTGVETLDLRGIGASRTLTLLNGRRPGGSGTRGQVLSLDLNAIPDIAVNRFEIVLDGSSSIYGSDAVAGVANIITRRSVDESSISVATEIPLDAGGEWYRFGAITGFNWDSGSFTASAQWTKQEALAVRDRDFLLCSQPLFTDAAGNNIDREDRSTLAGTPLGGCDSNLYANTILDQATGLGRLIPSPDGVTIGPIPGYRPRGNQNYLGSEGQAYFEDWLNFEVALNDHAINEQERINIYLTFDQNFGSVDWDADLLYYQRNTFSSGSRQFFPLIGGKTVFDAFGLYGYPNDPDYDPALPLGQPVMPYELDTEVDVDYFYFTTGLSGVFPTDNYWAWQVYGTYSYSDGDYWQNAIDTRLSGDAGRGALDAPAYDPYDPGYLSGDKMAELMGIIGYDTLGNTVYDQTQITAIVSGDLFQLPAGTLGVAVGAEYREFSIDDVPDELSQQGLSWGLTSATETQGSNDVWEAFGEVEVPILAGLPGVESLTVNGSVRTFDYERGGSDTVWKTGMRWQIVPSLALRGTVGTSYRAPALFEQFLGDQTSFGGQNAIDPCIDWQNSNNEFIRQNCSAVGVPGDYQGGGSSVLIITGGGVDNLEAETSDALTAGFVWTPEFTDLSLAVDYFEIEVNNQIAQLGAASIASGCYGGENFPNAFCDLLVRIPNTDQTRPNQIETINDSYVNINSQRVEGVDLNLTWNGQYDWGSLNLEAQSTWQFENVFQLFDPSVIDQFDDSDVVGEIGTPDNVTNFRATARKDDWSVTYFMQYISETDREDDFPAQTTYQGIPAVRDNVMDAAFYHNFSVFYQQDSWDFLLGINNLLDDTPDTVSSGFVSVRGNVPIVATQYDLLGRRIFGRVNFRF